MSWKQTKFLNLPYPRIYTIEKAPKILPPKIFLLFPDPNIDYETKLKTYTTTTTTNFLNPATKTIEKKLFCTFGYIQTIYGKTPLNETQHHFHTTPKHQTSKQKQKGRLQLQGKKWPRISPTKMGAFFGGGGVVARENFPTLPS